MRLPERVTDGRTDAGPARDGKRTGRCRPPRVRACTGGISARISPEIVQMRPTRKARPATGAGETRRWGATGDGVAYAAARDAGPARDRRDLGAASAGRRAAALAAGVRAAVPVRAGTARSDRRRVDASTPHGARIGRLALRGGGECTPGVRDGNGVTPTTISPMASRARRGPARALGCPVPPTPVRSGPRSHPAPSRRRACCGHAWGRPS